MNHCVRKLDTPWNTIVHIWKDLDSGFSEYDKILNIYKILPISSCEAKKKKCSKPSTIKNEFCAKTELFYYSLYKKYHKTFERKRINKGTKQKK